jgi:hypothetical protein
MAAQVIEMDQDDKPKEKTPTGWYKYWGKEKKAASKRLKQFQDQGNKVTNRFLDKRHGGSDAASGVNSSGGQFRLNLFHTNITTMQAMLYGSTPRIDVSREHHDPDDDIARVAGMLYERILSADVHNPNDDIPTALKAALQDRLLPGLGTCRVRYDLATTEVEKEAGFEGENAEGEEIVGEIEIEEELEYEEAPVDYVHWQDFLWGWGRTWAELPWIGFRSWLTKDEATARFGAKRSENLNYMNQLPSGDPANNDVTDPDQKSNVQKAEIWEFWDKKEKKVFWYADGADIILDAQDDPLNLDGFWPCPAPMMANLTTTLYQPRADFILSQDLYNEVDVLQSRIARITQAIKVVGVYDKSAGDSVGRMLKEGFENDLIPVDNWAMFADKGGLQGTIQWFPVQEVVGVLTTLRQLLAETIDLLYQVTGLSDIMRGANTDQYTSDGTNQLKAKFGSIRVQALQEEFAQFASDLEALKAEVISKHFSPESILKQSSAQFIPEADKDKIMPALQLMQSPEIKWRVNIRPESIAMVDYAQLKSERTEFLTAMATYIQSAQAAAKSVPESLPILLEMMKWGMAGFKGSDYLEGTMDQAIDMAKKAPPEGDKEGEKQNQAMQMQMQVIQAQSQAELQKIQAKSAADAQLAQVKFQGEMQKLQADSQSTMMEQQQKAQADLQKIAVDLQADLTVIRAKLDGDLQREEAQSTFAVAEAEVDHAYTMVEEQQSHLGTMAEIDEQGEQVRSEEDD